MESERGSSCPSRLWLSIKFVLTEKDKLRTKKKNVS